MSCSKEVNDPQECAPPKEKPSCNVCGKEFSSVSNVLRHQRTFHQNKKSAIMKISCENDEHNLFKKKSPSLKCEFCFKMFSYKSNYNRHKKIVHNVPLACKKNLKCPSCGEYFQSRAKFEDHIEKNHGLLVTKLNLHFNTVEAFETWKSYIEKKTLSRFIKRQQMTSSKQIVIMYICHRSGIYKNSGTGKRRIKLGGTNKINSTCPANIRVKSENSTTLFPATVTYTSLHMGHKCEVERINLSKEEKELLAGQLIAGVPMQNVLGKISEHTSPTERLAITSMQDLRNINKSYGICNNASSKKNKRKEEAKEAVMKFLGKMDDFDLDEQNEEITKTMIELTRKCHELGKSGIFSILPTTSCAPNKKESSQTKIHFKTEKI